MSYSKPSTTRSPDDVMILCALRTPLQRAKRGAFKDTYPEELLATVLRGILEKTKIDPALVQDIVVGNVLPAGGGAAIARMAALYAGFPESTSVATVNRQCASGLQAVASIAAAIQAGYIEIGIGAGVESMTMHYGPDAMPTGVSEKVASLPSAADCLLPMGITSENVASQFHISRERQDAFAALSHQKALEAQSKGWFKSEIVPVTVVSQTKKNNEMAKTHNDVQATTITVWQDDGIRAATTLETLAKLRPAFHDKGTTTAGNASQVTDGAAGVLLMKRKTAQRLGLPCLAKFCAFATIGVRPDLMGIGPAEAIPLALRQAGLSVSEIDIFEINEAFASQCVYCIDQLGLDLRKVNPKGGAIALGHPLGCTGTRQIATLLAELKRTGGRYGVTSMCIGTGMGAAAVFENEQEKEEMRSFL